MVDGYPVSLDSLITYVRSLQPAGRPLDNLADAIAVTAHLDEQSDALLGHFVDQARRSGASWTEIGAHLGVSKQAAHKRFVARFDGTDPVLGAQLLSRLTLRARNALVVAATITPARPDGAVDAARIVAGLLSEPEGLAAKIVHGGDVTDEQLCTALGVIAPAAPACAADATALQELRYTDDGEAVLNGALTAALRLGTNFLGTEHLLLGVVIAGGDAARVLVSLGLTVESVEAATRAEFAVIQARRQS